MELRTLKYFLAVAREENITRAAALLHLTQPTLSRQLIQLEEELGVQLFRRSQRKVILTDAGMLLLRRAQEIIDLSERTRQELRPETDFAGQISIGSGDFRSMSFFAELLARFHRLHPNVRYEIYSGNSDGIKERIERGLLDIGLLLEPVDLSRYEVLRLPVQEEWGILVPADSALASLPSVTPRDLADKPIIYTSRELMQRELLRWFGPYAERLHIAACSNLPHNQLQLSRYRIGVSLCLKLDWEYEGLRFVPLSPPLFSNIVLAWKKTETFSAATDALLQYAQEYINGISGDSI